MQDGPLPFHRPTVDGAANGLAGTRAIPHTRQTNRTVPLPRGPGVAVRSPDPSIPPVPPPRPPNTLSSRSRPVIPAKTSANIPTVPSLPPRPSPLSISILVESEATIDTDQPPSTISLTSPRPGPNRTQNLYVDAPLRSPPIVKQPLGRAGSFPLPQSTSNRSATKSSTDSGSKHLPLLSHQPTVIQPLTLKKDKELSDFVQSSAESILCRNCNQCRCKACREPRRLPEYYLCKQKCLCSSETVVDTLSGMCLVKALFYHCGKDYASEVDSVFENPCSCTGEFAPARWGCMAAMSLVMPCLLCYLPLKGLTNVCQDVYARCTTTGCRCDIAKLPESTFETVRNNNQETVVDSPISNGPSSPVDSEKRLLS